MNRSDNFSSEEDMTYWCHRTPVGIKVEEISGGIRYSGRVWELMARQVWCENGREGNYRSIVHTPAGAPLLEDSTERISLSHTKGIMVVATLPPTPEVNLKEFSPRAAMGIDTESVERQILPGVRDKVFSDREQTLIAANDAKANLLGWSCKEALYKAALGGGKSWAEDYRLMRLPDPETGTLGEGEVNLPHGVEPFILYAWRSGIFFIVIALSPRCATFKKEDCQ